VPRLFTLDEAEALLPTIVPILEAIREAHGELTAAQGEIGERLRPVQGNGHHVDGDALGRLRESGVRAAAIVQQRTATLAELDVELKDPSTGLIDFRSEREGRVVYLCWRLGEPRIDWWHELDAGFIGRQRLDRD
jgi:hypothetical protein